MAETLVRIMDRPEPILAYGRGGFRFTSGIHRGSLLITPDAAFAWPVSSVGDLSHAIPVLAAAGLDFGDFFLLGTGETQQFPPAGVRDAFDAIGAYLEVLETGAACRTFNLLRQEQRVFSAGLIAM
jgi:uncharacterized protein